MTEFKDEKLLRDALGSPVPQYFHVDLQTFAATTTDGSVADVDFSKVKLLRDKLGSPIPQLWDTEVEEFVPDTGQGGGGATQYGEVADLIAISNTVGTTIEVTWVNPVATEFVKTELFASKTNITNLNYDTTVSAAIKVVDDNSTLLWSQATLPGEIWYFKAFTTYTSLGIVGTSKGMTVAETAIDVEPPNSITNFIVSKEDNGSLVLTWINPTDADFSKTKITYQLSDYPVAHTEGTVAYEGSGNTVTITGLTNDEVYYISGFAFDNSGNINSDASQRTTGTPSDSKIYGVKIDTTNSNPQTAITYTDNAVGFTPLSVVGGVPIWGSWADKYPFNQIVPVVVKNGVEQYELNPNDFTKKKDGTASDITTGNDGDVFSKFPKLYWKFETIGTDLFVRMSEKQIDSTYKCLAHKSGDVEFEHTYIGTYLGYDDGTKLRSLSGKTVTASQTIGSFRTKAKVNGANYNQFPYFDVLMIQILTLIATKGRDSQASIGRGYVDGNASYATTGGTNEKGMIYGETTGNLQMKLFGIEDLWGNYYQFIDGLYSDANRNILIGDTNFNDTGEGYTNYGQGTTADVSGYISNVQGGTETGFITKDVVGSETTHYPDYGGLSADRLPYLGGDRADGSRAGVFLLSVNRLASNIHAYCVARCCFKK